MKTMTKTVRRFLRNESGATALEYALIVAFVSVVIVGVVFALGVDLVGLFQSIVDVWPS